MKICGVVGWKNSGKTFLAQKLISYFNEKELIVSSIKHAHHDFDIDQPKTDSYLLRKAGSQQVIVSSAKRWVKINELKDSSEKKLNELINELENPEVVIVEGFKNENHPKIEIIKNSHDGSSFMFNNLNNIVALISDIHIDSFTHSQFKKNQIKQIVEFILSYKK